jgi:hypothetical protein
MLKCLSKKINLPVFHPVMPPFLDLSDKFVVSLEDFGLGVGGGDACHGVVFYSKI